MQNTTPIERYYDFICFGDEVPGILAIVSAAREYRRRFGYPPRSLVMFQGNSAEGVGGHLVRGGLAYLDRSSIPFATRQALRLDDFGDPPAIYKEFLQRVGVVQVALDPRKASQVLRQMLAEAGADILSNVKIQSILKDGQTISGIHLTRGEIYRGKQFIDSTVNAELAQAAGVKKLKGFETFGLPNSELSVTLVFEVQGLPINELKAIEAHYLRRFNNPADTQAQSYINAAAWSDPSLVSELKQNLARRDAQGQYLTMLQGKDYLDVRSKALSVAYHSFRGTKLSEKESSAIFDNGNIAILPGGRLSWNALLFQVNADQAEALAQNRAKPTAAMLEEMAHVEQWFKSLGATSITPATELYIRHAGNITGAVDPLSGAEMLRGGVPANEALGTFGYQFDARGGIKGLSDRANGQGFNTIHFRAPLLNVGIRHALVKSVPNLAVVSPASGFEGYACSAGRIVEFNTGVGQGVGIAAVLALSNGQNLASISNVQVRQVLAQTGRLPKIYGEVYLADANALSNFEQTLYPVAIA
ncbi:MAG: hypothetical protein Kow00121_28280 [Elainellaceae cyanobacterium]